MALSEGTTKRAGGVRVARPLFHAEGGGSTPTSALCHQKSIRDKAAMEYRPSGLFNDIPSSHDRADIGTSVVRRVSWRAANAIILKYEWLGSMAMKTTDCFGIYFGGFLAGVCCFSPPPTPHVAMGAIGKDHVNLVKVLSRGACVWWAHEHSASKLISLATKIMVSETRYRVFLAFSDPRAMEIGTVYQASNWIYTGITNSHTSYFIGGAWRTERSARQESYRIAGIDFRKCPKKKEPGKHRYLKLDAPTKRERQYIRGLIRYEGLPYPKRT